MTDTTAHDVQVGQNGAPEAIVSDIHGNAVALNAVLRALREWRSPLTGAQVKARRSLGDIVGYGPLPAECVVLVRKFFEWSLIGNHDDAVVRADWDGFNPIAAASAVWTRSKLAEFDREHDSRELSPDETWVPPADGLVAYLAGLEPERALSGVRYVHASPKEALHEYLIGSDVGTDYDFYLYENFGLLDEDALCFCGHTHKPGVFVLRPFNPDDMDPGDSRRFFDEHPGTIEFIPQGALSSGYYELVPGTKTIVNVGSVGQPRDKDPRACCVIREGSRIYFLRVPYDVEKVVQQIAGEKALDSFLGERLLGGR